MLPIFIVFDTDFVQEDKLLSGQYDPFLHFLKHHDVNIEEVHKFHVNLFVDDEYACGIRNVDAFSDIVFW